MSVHAIEDCRMIACYRVNVFLCRRFLFCPQRMVPATANYPLSRPGGLDASGNALLHVIQRFAADKIDVEFFKAAGAEMHVRVIKAGHHKLAAEVDDLSLWAFELLNFFVRSSGDDFSIRNSQSFYSSGKVRLFGY